MKFKFIEIPLLLNAKSQNKYIKQAKALYKSDFANVMRIVYKWETKKPIPRLKGKSIILYIGSTLRSLKKRHLQYAGKQNSRLKWDIFKHVVNKYGFVRVSYRKVDKPKKEERKMLESYKKYHLEYPPLNCI